MHPRRQCYRAKRGQVSLPTRLDAGSISREVAVAGCYMTRDILANIETQRSPVTDKQIEFLAEVLQVQVWDFFPSKRHFCGRAVGLDIPILNRRRSPHRHSCHGHARHRGRLAHATKK